MSELNDSVDKNKLYFEYEGPTRDVSFYEYMDSKELFNKLKGNRIRFSHEQETCVKNLENFYKSREEVLNFFRDYTEMFFNASYKANQDKTKGPGLKILTPKQMLQRLPIALAQVKAGNNSENLLNEIRQIVYSLYQSKKKSLKKYTIT